MPFYVIVLILTAVTVFLLGIALLVRALIEPGLLEADRERIPLSGETEGKNDVPLLRVAFFSDIHGMGCKVSIKKITDAIFSQPCDAILFGGDITNSRTSATEGLAILRAISDLSVKQSVPCYAVRGNHDRFVTAADFAMSGFHMLENEAVTISGCSGKKFVLIGIDDSGKKKRVWPELPGPLPA